MSGQAELGVMAATVEAIDDCWNRIGVHGDKSCPLLAEHVHCRNCQVYAAAATRLLDRYALAQDAHAQTHVQAPVSVGRSLLLFRLGEEWLALATRCLVEVAPLQPVHSLPHQRSRVLQGWPMCAVRWCRACRWATCWGSSPAARWRCRRGSCRAC